MTREDLNDLKEEVHDLMRVIDHIKEYQEDFTALVEDIGGTYETKDEELKQLFEEIYMEDDIDYVEEPTNHIWNRILEIEETWTDEDFEEDEEV